MRACEVTLLVLIAFLLSGCWTRGVTDSGLMSAMGANYPDSPHPECRKLQWTQDDVDACWEAQRGG